MPGSASYLGSKHAIQVSNMQLFMPLLAFVEIDLEYQMTAEWGRNFGVLLINCI